MNSSEKVISNFQFLLISVLYSIIKLKSYENANNKDRQHI